MSVWAIGLAITGEEKSGSFGFRGVPEDFLSWVGTWFQDLGHSQALPAGSPRVCVRSLTLWTRSASHPRRLVIAESGSAFLGTPRRHFPSAVVPPSWWHSSSLPPATCPVPRTVCLPWRES